MEENVIMKIAYDSAKLLIEQRMQEYREKGSALNVSIIAEGFKKEYEIALKHLRTVNQIEMNNSPFANNGLIPETEMVPDGKIIPNTR